MEKKRYEEAKEKEKQEFLAASRREKQEAWAYEAKRQAVEKARIEADVKARFKASEAERTRVEAEKRAEERKLAREKEAAFRQKMEEERKKEKAALRERERASKQALKEARASMYVEDADGKLHKIPDPAIEINKRMRELEAEREKAIREQDAALAAKSAAFEKVKKEQALQRAKQVEAAQREVAASTQRDA